MSKQARFNRDEVIEKAKNLYWEKGYHATSMRNLQDVVDMRPGSIYAAFGSKDNLFKEALNCYAKESAERLTDCLAHETTFLGGLKRFVRSLTLGNKDIAPSSRCMIVKSISELTQKDHPDLLASATIILKKTEQALVNIFQQAIDNKELSQDKNPAELARFMQVQIIGLRTYTQVADNSEVVEKLIDDVFNKLNQY